MEVVYEANISYELSAGSVALVSTPKEISLLFRAGRNNRQFKDIGGTLYLPPSNRPSHHYIQSSAMTQVCVLRTPFGHVPCSTTQSSAAPQNGTLSKYEDTSKIITSKYFVIYCEVLPARCTVRVLYLVQHGLVVLFVPQSVLHPRQTRLQNHGEAYQHQKAQRGLSQHGTRVQTKKGDISEQ